MSLKQQKKKMNAISTQNHAEPLLPGFHKISTNQKSIFRGLHFQEAIKVLALTGEEGQSCKFNFCQTKLCNYYTNRTSKTCGKIIKGLTVKITAVHTKKC